MKTQKDISRLRKLEDNARSANKKVYDLEKKILKETLNGDPVVTDHAVIRFLERVHGIDICALKAKMLTAQDKAAIGLGVSRIRKEGCCYVIEDKTVVTVI